MIQQRTESRSGRPCVGRSGVRPALCRPARGRPAQGRPLHAWTIAIVVAMGAAAQPPADPWAALEAVRGRLAAAGPRLAEFEHLYTPAGFSQGEKEVGKLYLSLPDCLRWDYEEPYPKSFLVCGNVAHYWNREDGTGRRQVIDRNNEPGLDLLLLSTAELKSRYDVRAEETADGQVRLHLSPAKPLREIKEAMLTVDPKGGVVTGLEYRDDEGNRTQFILRTYRTLIATDLFSPPTGITWQEGEDP